ncbi:MAG: DMT family transporter [Myxococcota bacterium]|nr:DMT family transporter [Myxococcota bacterium]
MSTMQQKRATWALLLMTFIWGYTFIWIKSALNAGDRLLGAEALPITVGLFMVIRFLGAALILPVALPAARERLTDPAVWRAGGVLSFFVLAGFLLQMFGMHGIDSATSAFLTSLYVVFTAIALAAWTRTLPSKTLIIGIACATLGAGFISGPPQLTFDLPEWLTVICAAAFAGHIIGTDYYTKRLPPLTITLTTFVITGGCCALLFVVGWVRHGEIEAAQVVTLLTDFEFLFPSVMCLVFGSVICLTIMNIYQRHLSPVRAAILFTLEPVWAALLALGAGQIEPDGWFLFGAGALLGGNLIVEVVPRLIGKPSPPAEAAERSVALGADKG